MPSGDISCWRVYILLCIVMNDITRRSGEPDERHPPGNASSGPGWRDGGARANSASALGSSVFVSVQFSDIKNFRVLLRPSSVRRKKNSACPRVRPKIFRVFFSVVQRQFFGPVRRQRAESARPPHVTASDLRTRFLLVLLHGRIAVYVLALDGRGWVCP